MNNGSPTWKPIGSGGANWVIAETGDFNGDGADDILWFNTVSDSVGQFEMNNGSPTWKTIGTSGANWQVAGTGDFNGDGTDDILWFNTVTNSVGQFEMNNGSATWQPIGTAGANWEIAGTAAPPGSRSARPAPIGRSPGPATSMATAPTTSCGSIR
jgi:hypothetical protein